MKQCKKCCSVNNSVVWTHGSYGVAKTTRDAKKYAMQMIRKHGRNDIRVVIVGDDGCCTECRPKVKKTSSNDSQIKLF